MRLIFKSFAVLAMLLVLAVAPSAFAETQIVDATLGGALSMTGDPTDVLGWALSVGPNQTSGGTMVIQSNGGYTVKLLSDKPALSEWDPAANGGAGGYVALGKQLGLPVLVTATVDPAASTLGAVGGAAAATDSDLTGLLLATNLVGLGTDTYDLTLSQTVSLTDQPLTNGNTYHSVFTYTAASTLP